MSTLRGAIGVHDYLLSSRIHKDLLPCVHLRASLPFGIDAEGVVDGLWRWNEPREAWLKRNVPETIQDRVLRLVAGVRRIPVETVTPESTFEDLGMDSLDKLNLLFEVENEFDVEIDDQEAKQICRVSEMIAGVTQLVEAKEKSSSPI